MAAYSIDRDNDTLLLSQGFLVVATFKGAHGKEALDLFIIGAIEAGHSVVRGNLGAMVISFPTKHVAWGQLDD